MSLSYVLDEALVSLAESIVDVLKGESKVRVEPTNRTRDIRNGFTIAFERK